MRRIVGVLWGLDLTMPLLGLLVANSHRLSGSPDEVAMNPLNMLCLLGLLVTAILSVLVFLWAISANGLREKLAGFAFSGAVVPLLLLIESTDTVIGVPGSARSAPQTVAILTANALWVVMFLLLKSRIAGLAGGNEDS